MDGVYVKGCLDGRNDIHMSHSPRHPFSRYWDMMDQTYVMNEVKESCCYVSQDFLTDLETCRNTRDNPILQEYILPDFSRNSKGFIREKKGGGMYDQSDEQVLYMNNERFAVPEILFNPSDIGMNQAGIPEVIVESINATHPGISFYSEKDLRVLAPSEFEVKVGMPEE
ncbi:11341_t:CDS:2 [Acaulospora colombiana]|uniref:11341_t:CDS:1 n=1 Tax=Acaulospora colombiana TaxID=27376 RepID=A0ACA9L4I8_9GLOM|nr:11341_t:CDS:2 [Acaulospora colombiana]